MGENRPHPMRRVDTQLSRRLAARRTQGGPFLAGGFGRDGPLLGGPVRVQKKRQHCHGRLGAVSVGDGGGKKGGDPPVRLAAIAEAAPAAGLAAFAAASMINASSPAGSVRSRSSGGSGHSPLKNGTKAKAKAGGRK